MIIPIKSDTKETLLLYCNPLFFREICFVRKYCLICSKSRCEILLKDLQKIICKAELSLKIVCKLRLKINDFKTRQKDIFIRSIFMLNVESTELTKTISQAFPQH